MEHYKSDYPLLDFKLVSCGKEQCIPQKIVSEIGKEYFTLHYVVDGSGYFEMGNFKQKLNAGDLFVIHPNEAVNYYPDDKKPWVYSWMVFDGLLASPIIKDIFGNGNIVTVGKHTELIELFDRLTYQFYEYEEINLSMIGLSYIILSKILTMLNKENNVNTSKDYSYFTEVKDFINYNYSFGISIDNIAKSKNLSSSYIRRLFVKYENKSTKEYLTEVRMKRAQEVIMQKGYKVKDVAFMVGYQDSLHFSKEFKKYFGVSPNEYKNKKN